jgi:AhpD family alkylhydroperoxidase
MPSTSCGIRRDAQNGGFTMNGLARHDDGHSGHVLEKWHGLIPRKLLALLDQEPELKDAFLAFGKALTTRLDTRACETVALAVSDARGCRYVWPAHVLIALGNGLSREDIARIAAGAGACDGRDAAVLRGVEAVLDHRPLDASTQRELGGDALAVTLAIGFYELVTVLTHDFEPEPDVVPFHGLESPARARTLLPV